MSRERLKSETSNLTCGLATGGPKLNNAKLGQKGSSSVTWPTFKILQPPPYFEIGWSYKLQIWHADWPQGVLTKKSKIRSKGVVKGSGNLLLEFWEPVHISGTVEASNFKFGMQIGYWVFITYWLLLGHRFQVWHF